MARRMQPPAIRLNIVVSVLRGKVRLKSCAEVYPHEFTGRDVTMRNVKRGYNVQLYPIVSNTPIRAREANEIIAYYFKRESGYNFAGYHPKETQDERDRIFLLLEETDWDERYAVGAFVFRWRRYEDLPEQLVLAWVWIHPFLRQAGIFSTYWNIFKEIYGDFRVEPPYSKSMNSFLQKMHVPTEYEETL